ncbi:MAG: glycosyltransferase family 4 protein [Corallincola sp.]|nr:glycosyltransferase family 4 protein [Corallincola sp.]
MKVIILHKRFVADGRIIIGGIETYIRNLCALCQQMGWQAVVAQPAIEPYAIVVEGISVVGVDCGNSRHRKLRQKLADWALTQIDRQRDIIIFAADWFSVDIDYPRTIHIQHGITWDMPRPRSSLLRLWSEAREQLRHARLFENSHYKVCVDYNFLNWYRSLRSVVDEQRIEVIPNFADIAADVDVSRHKHDAPCVKILFARRLVAMRGTRIMAGACHQLLRSTRHVVEICFAGDGPDEQWLKQQFASDPRVSFCTYHPSEAAAIHQRYDIAVVPSLGSEGTSLSLIEAMAAGCAVVCTNVGGMTNLVIDGFNGRLVKPDQEALSIALQELVEDSQLRYQLAVNAMAVASQGLSLLRWRQRWRQLLERVSAEPLAEG